MKFSLLLVALLGALPFFQLRGDAPAPALSADDVLTWRDNRFYLDGKPFAEMSFNKFDLLWSIWQGINIRDEKGDATALNTAVARQDKALRDLHEMGFRTIRIFGTPFVHDAATLQRALESKALFEAIDTTLDLCERNHIQVIYSLGLGTFVYDGETAPVPGAPPQPMPLYTDPNSPARQHCYAFIDELVSRYRNRRGIAMWEVSNELTLLADIGIRAGRVSPTLPQVASFLDACAARIKRNDPLRLVSDGGSSLRPSAWHEWHAGPVRVDWTKDSEEQYRQAYAAYFAHSAIDVIDTHYYEFRQGGMQLANGADGRPVSMRPAQYMDIVRSLGKGGIIGECGTLPSGWDASHAGGKPVDPAWFVGYHDPNAVPWVTKAVDEVVDARVPLIYWWAYQSDRPVDQFANPVVFSRDDTPNLMKIICDGNRRLKAEFGAQ